MQGSIKHELQSVFGQLEGQKLDAFGRLPHIHQRRWKGAKRPFRGHELEGRSWVCLGLLAVVLLVYGSLTPKRQQKHVKT